MYSNTTHTVYKQLFGIDGAGACLTVGLLVGVVAPYESLFGMPTLVVYRLAAVAALLAVYSLGCARYVGQRWATYLTLVAVANLLYGCLTLGLVAYHWQRLSGWGITYFLLEMAVVGGLGFFELRTTRVGT